jgi:protein-L-isoaspartate O-methyltransferase
MIPQYHEIKSAYDRFYNSLLSEGKLPLKDTGKGFWGISTADDVFHLFKSMKLGKYRSFIDLGSGDGKVVLIASLFTKATGIEFDSDLVGHSERIRDKLGLNAKFIKGDFLEHSLKGHDFIFINPDQQMKDLEPKLFTELKGKLVVYGPHYHPKMLKKEARFIANTTPVSVYVNLR